MVNIAPFWFLPIIVSISKSPNVLSLLLFYKVPLMLPCFLDCLYCFLIAPILISFIKVVLKWFIQLPLLNAYLPMCMKYTLVRDNRFAI